MPVEAPLACRLRLRCSRFLLLLALAVDADTPMGAWLIASSTERVSLTSGTNEAEPQNGTVKGIVSRSACTAGGGENGLCSAGLESREAQPSGPGAGAGRCRAAAGCACAAFRLLAARERPPDEPEAATGKQSCRVSKGAGQGRVRMSESWTVEPPCPHSVKPRRS